MNEYGKFLKQKNRRKIPTFAQLRHDLLDSENWRAAKPNTKCLVLELLRQYNGFNNGDLSISYAYLKRRGWRSQNTLNKAIQEAIHLNLIVKTRQGGLYNTPCLYAVTWLNIDHCKGKMDLQSPTKTALNTWKIPVKNAFDYASRIKVKPRKNH